MTVKSYEIVNDFLDKDVFESIKTSLLSDKIPWFNMIGPWGCFNHQFFSNIDSSPFFDILDPLTEKLNVKLPIEISGKLFCNTGALSQHMFPVKVSDPHTTAIFFVNTNDGVTILDDNTKISSVENSILFYDGSRQTINTNCADQRVRLLLKFDYF